MKDNKKIDDKFLLKKELGQTYKRINVLEKDYFDLINKNKQLKSEISTLETFNEDIACTKKTKNKITKKKAKKIFVEQEKASPSSILSNLKGNINFGNSLDMTSKESLKLIIKNTDETELANILSVITKTPIDEILDVEDVQKKANQLVDIAMSEYPDVKQDTETIAFAKRIKSDNSPKIELNEFEKKTKKIYATFKLLEYEKSEVFVKWIHLDTSRILVFSRYKIRKSKTNYIWMRQDEWESGDYRVEIYSPIKFQLLAFGEYIVTDPEEEEIFEN